MKKILGLDLGTNSIGWALVEEGENETKEILGIGSRIIPIDQGVLGKFDNGVTESQTAVRTQFRGVRRLRERHLLRRERLHRVLHIMEFLPKHYEKYIDFENKLGKFISDTEPKLVWKKNENGRFDFIFKTSFNEMVEEFRITQPQLIDEDKLIPYDWTIYYLRKKALQQKIEKEELAWLLLNFNQKRGYYQLRGEEEEENPNKLVEFHSLKVTEVNADESQKGKSDIWYSIILENGWIYRRSSKTPLFDWKDKIRDFIVTTDLNNDGTIKVDIEGKEKRSFRAPSEDDWTLLKKKTESDIDKSHKTVGCYIYDTLLQNPTQKINGKLVRTIERKFYKQELHAILEKQKEFHAELKNFELYHACLNELYGNNESHRNSNASRDFTYLFLNDIIFYQRPLKSKKSLISNCKYETRTFINKETGEKQIDAIKCIAKSHPLYQELRLWKFIQDLKIIEREKDINGKLNTDVDVTNEFLQTEDDYVELFDWLNKTKEIKQDTLLSSYFKIKKKKGEDKLSHRWNYVEDKEYPCNETRAQFLNRLNKVSNVPENFLDKETEIQLWHLLYSVEDKLEIEKALKSFAVKNHLGDDFVDVFKKFPPFKKEYGAYSEKAIKKFLPFMRMGKYWKLDSIDEKTKLRIEKIISGECDETIQNRVRQKAIEFTSLSDCKCLPEWLVGYLIYGIEPTDKWNTPEDLEAYLRTFKQHSLRNPIVEQVITETLRTVKDIWKYYGDFSEIHIELGREMKNPADKRKTMTAQITENENSNLRIKYLLAELINHSDVENVRPYSPSQQEILKLYEDGVLNSGIEIPEDISKIVKQSQPSKSDLIRYKLWLEQKYRSPYTGEMIPLGRLFTSSYEIEHVIPQSRYFDDSFSNKVICEAAVNKEKDNALGYEFIKNNEGRIIELSYGKSVKIFTVSQYEDFVKQYYGKSRGKMKKLLMEDIPEAFVERQLNDTRYITKVVKGLLSNIVREEGELESTSKNVISCTGGVTTILKQDWGLNDVWNRIVTPRFERMNELTKSNNFGQWTNKDGKRVFQTEMPLELQKGFNKKRIDHRHHAMDALVIACATRSHINYLNNESAKPSAKESRTGLKNKLCYKSKTDNKGNYKWQFYKPWDSFTEDAQVALENIVVSFKQNLRVINKTVNKYQVIENGKKVIKTQETRDSWAIRKPLHKEFVFGKVDLPRIKAPKGKIVVAIRRSLDKTFDLKKIETITDTGIQKILKNYLLSKNYDPQLAFSQEGIEEMNANIKFYNEGKSHKPILKIRTFEIGSRFSLGEKGNKKDKYVEAAKGTNLFFAIYVDEDSKRSYETIQLNIVIERLKQGLSEVPETNDNGNKLLFHLSPNDLVYVPTEDERINLQKINLNNTTRLFEVNDFSGYTIYFTPNRFAKAIAPKELDTSFDTKLTKYEGVIIKDVCIKLKIDRLGNITI
ncbi:MAG: HNH endonuclease domain-containing protein [Paludibacter sp.]|nr:HNH endonuclease domain-containing protein [Paludibacter sp.]